MTPAFDIGIVSRRGTLGMTLASVFCQTILPQRVVVYFNGDFPNVNVFKMLQSRGIECEAMFCQVGSKSLCRMRLEMLPKLGEHFFFIDDDIILRENYCEEVMRYITDKPFNFARGRFFNFLERGFDGKDIGGRGRILTGLTAFNNEFLGLVDFSKYDIDNIHFQTILTTEIVGNPAYACEVVQNTFAYQYGEQQYRSVWSDTMNTMTSYARRCNEAGQECNNRSVQERRKEHKTAVRKHK